MVAPNQLFLVVNIYEKALFKDTLSIITQFVKANLFAQPPLYILLTSENFKQQAIIIYNHFAVKALGKKLRRPSPNQ